MNLDSLFKSEKVGLYDWGQITTVYLTGRFIDTDQDSLPNHFESRFKTMVEVRTGRFWGSTKWVSLNNLKEIKEHKK